MHPHGRRTEQTHDSAPTGRAINGACSRVCPGGLAAAALTVLPPAVAAPAHAAETLPRSETITRCPVADQAREACAPDAALHGSADTILSGDTTSRAAATACTEQAVTYEQAP